jgi:hypothetical protein
VVPEVGNTKTTPLLSTVFAFIAETIFNFEETKAFLADDFCYISIG